MALIQVLPLEILDLIARHLLPPDLDRLSMTCRLFNQGLRTLDQHRSFKEAYGTIELEHDITEDDEGGELPENNMCAFFEQLKQHRHLSWYPRHVVYSSRVLPGWAKYAKSAGLTDVINDMAPPLLAADGSRISVEEMIVTANQAFGWPLTTLEGLPNLTSLRLGVDQQYLEDSGDAIKFIHRHRPCFLQNLRVLEIVFEDQEEQAPLGDFNALWDLPSLRVLRGYRLDPFFEFQFDRNDSDKRTAAFEGIELITAGLSEYNDENKEAPLASTNQWVGLFQESDETIRWVSINMDSLTLWTANERGLPWDIFAPARALLRIGAGKRLEALSLTVDDVMEDMGSWRKDADLNVGLESFTFASFKKLRALEADARLFTRTTETGDGWTETQLPMAPDLPESLEKLVLYFDDKWTSVAEAFDGFAAPTTLPNLKEVVIGCEDRERARETLKTLRARDIKATWSRDASKPTSRYEYEGASSIDFSAEEVLSLSSGK